VAAGLADGGVVIWDLEQVRASLAEFGFVVPSTAARGDVARPPHLGSGDFEKIVSFHRQTHRDRVLAAHRAVVEREPNNAAAHSTLGDVLGRQGRTDEAVRAFRMALELDPNSAQAYNGLAWQLATCADTKFRDPAQAVALAEKAVDLNPAALTWQTLGWARYRAGDWKGSVAAQTESMGLQQAPKGGDAGQWFCLALAHWQLGNKDEARQWYDRAVDWTEKCAAPGETLARFRGEAGELLGVDGSGQRASPTAPATDNSRPLRK
jgi:tetratricopeptide (TPR) repeat protein